MGFSPGDSNAQYRFFCLMNAFVQQLSNRRQSYVLNPIQKQLADLKLCIFLWHWPLLSVPFGWTAFSTDSCTRS